MKCTLLKQMVDEKLSTRKIAKELSCSQSTVKHWLKKYGLKTFVPNKLSVKEIKEKQVIRVANRRRTLKLMGIEYKGGKCIKCGYDKCVDALDFHHVGPGKDFGLASKGYTHGWERVKEELDKCILLCANCHREEHSKIRTSS